MSEVIAFKRAPEDLSVNAVCKRIREALYRRSGVRWSVTHGTGTAYGWITIDAPKACRIAQDVERAEPVPYHKGGTHETNYIESKLLNPTGHMGPLGRAKLAALLGLDRPCHFQGESIPAGHDYYREYIDRAEGRTPRTQGQPYWD